MSFLRELFTSKPVKVILLFCLGVLWLSRDPWVREHDLFMSWDEITKRVPGLPKMPDPPGGAPVATSNAAPWLVNNAVTNNGKVTYALDPFFAALTEASRTNGPARVARVMHWGDSLIWGDNFTGKLRSLFTNTFGDGGRGLLPVALEDSSYELKGVTKQRFSGWDTEVLITTQSKLSRLGLTLRRWDPRGTGTSALSFTPGESATRLAVLHDGPAAFTLEAQARDGAKLALAPTNGTPCWTEFRAGAPVASLSLRADKGAILGWYAEKTRGVAYSSVVRKGIFAQDFRQVDRELFSAQLAAVKPDLLVYQFGKNEAGWGPFRIEEHAAGVRRFLEMARAADPKVPVLLLGPGGRLWTIGGKLQVLGPIKPMLAAQARLAREFGAAFVDGMAAMGGEDAILKMIAKGHAMTDYVHLTVAGGDWYAEKLFGALLAEYRAYLSRTKADGSSLLGYFSQSNQKKGQISSASSSINFDTVAFFIFFLPVFFIWWMLFRAYTLRLVFMLLASWYFYMSWNPIFLTLILLSAGLDFSMGLLIHRARVRQTQGQARLFLALSLCGNLGLLFFFKYFNLFAEFANMLRGPGNEIPFISLILPVGISFYTFQTMSYTIDIFRGHLKPTKSLFKFAVFVSLFPQLVAGPIVRARQFIPQLLVRLRFDPLQIQTGMFLVVVGLFKKVVLSDYIAVNFVERVFAAPTMYSGLEVLFAVYGYALQIYCDFSGYSDIAIGAAAMLGFRLPLNFDSPYQSVSLQEFWRRWHISLSTWLRDYLYIPLGGSRHGQFRTYANLAITMLLGGLWHGAAFKFILWGAIHGVGLGIVRAFQRLRERSKIAWLRTREKSSVWGVVLAWLLTFHFVCFAWIFFRAKDMTAAGEILGQIATLTTHLPNVTYVIALVLAGGFALHMVPNRFFERFKRVYVELPAPMQSLALLLFAAFLYKTATAELVPFIYFQF